MTTASVHDLKNDLKMMFVKRFLGHGFKLPVIFSDECCDDRQLLLTMFKEIELETGARLYDTAEEAGGGSPGVEVLPALEFPPGKRGECVFDFRPNSIAPSVVALTDGCQLQGNVLGLDCEWEPSLAGTTPNPVSTVQLSLPDGTAYCFQLQRGNKKTTSSNFPKALQNLLENPSIAKVGVNINSDATYLERDYGIEVANTVDLRTYARQCWVETPSRSLAGMASSLLGRQLPKDPVIRSSRWSSPLSDNQEVAKFQDPIFSPPPVELHPGTKVRLYSNNHASCVGVGEVQDDDTAAEALAGWFPGARRKGRLTQVVVGLSGVFKPAAYTAHKGTPSAASGVGRVTMDEAYKGDRLVLWDVAHVRLVSDWKPSPAAAAPSSNENASEAYNDNAQFFTSPRPPHVVRLQDDEDPDDGDEEEYDGHDCGDLGSSARGDHGFWAGVEAGGGGGGAVNGTGGAGNGTGGAGSGTGGVGSGTGGAGSGGDVDMDDWLGDEQCALQVRLDIFHALQRISRLCKKSHGAFKPFMARLRDACFIVNQDDIKEVEQALGSKGMTPEAVAEYKDKNWTYFLRNCRRLVPERQRLLERFNSVINQFCNVVDAKSGEVLIRPKAMQAVDQLRKHIESDCLSDPHGVPLYYTTGQNAAGITTRRCVRGTNYTEFNYRWNIRMAVKNRGLPREVGEFFDQFEIEIIQRETSSWYPDNPLFPEWISALDAADTGEKSGLSQSL
ncbi:similar to Werner syndrome protein [Ectocarpus siliculosus]|uniref:3'-5' exonuclease n=1 Tax=Ectocarpus siliculosus TaxID=2880 RepID=D7FIV1_ECTSI|nr:similar to Werner syndrome protein [Ectocarpus siliculosus]CBN75519.1 similar to Werner syndrome protein [Ectocarpus siliculosus]|eukprot:CBJ28935.1 similar to Werner syndrome protein [Ectocarpus siliculosus]